MKKENNDEYNRGYEEGYEEGKEDGKTTDNICDNMVNWKERIFEILPDGISTVNRQEIEEALKNIKNFIW